MERLRKGADREAGTEEGRVRLMKWVRRDGISLVRRSNQ